MKKICFIICVALCSSTTNAQQKKSSIIKVLIIDGFSNHDWKQTTKLTRQMLEQTGLFEVSVSTTPATATDSNWINWSPNFSAYDVIVQNTNNINDKAIRWPEKIEAQLVTYVKNGGGLYILHSGNNAFSHWKKYDTLIGMGWRKADAGIALQIDKDGKIIRIPAGEGKSTYHGKRTDLVLNKFADHPINHDFPKQWKAADMELYQFARGPAENITILSYARDSATDINWPVEWVIKYGKGNVYNSSMGHLWTGDVYPISYRCIAFQTSFIRAMEWLATGKCTYQVPSDFPTKDSVSLRPLPE